MECNTRVMFIILFSVTLLVGHIDGRKGPIKYWAEMMKDQPIPEAFEGLLDQRPNEATMKEEQIESISNNFNTIPNVSPFRNDLTKKETSSQKEDCNSHHDGVTSEKVTANGFEPRPTITGYVEFEPRPTISADKELESRPIIIASKNFEPRHTALVYKDLESKPTVTAYNDLKPRPTVTAYIDFEPRPTATAYND